MINIMSCSHKHAEINIIMCEKIDCNWNYQTCPLVDDPNNIPGRLYLIEIRKEKGGSWLRAAFGEGNSVMPSWECSLFKKSQGLLVEIFFFYRPFTLAVVDIPDISYLIPQAKSVLTMPHLQPAANSVSNSYQTIPPKETRNKDLTAIHIYFYQWTQSIHKC